MIREYIEPGRDPLIGLDDDLIAALAMKFEVGGHRSEMTFESYIRAVLGARMEDGRWMHSII